MNHIVKMDFIIIKNVCSVEITAKGQVADQEDTFANRIWDKELVSGIYTAPKIRQ